MRQLFEIEGLFNHLNGVSFTDTNNGTIVGHFDRRSPNESMIIRTTNGGSAWTQQKVPFENALYGVCFTDSSTGTAVGSDGLILRTTDAGAVWTQQTSGTSVDLWDVCFTDSDHGTIVGEYGRILRTTDGGATWNHQTSGTTYNLNGVSFIDSNTGLAVGNGPNSTILKTTDGGAMWTQQTSVSSFDLNDVSCTDINNATAVGLYGTIIRTTNGGGATAVEEETGKKIPQYFVLSQNYPNPFNPVTMINYSVPRQSHVTITIFDALGRKSRTLVNEEKPAGHFQVEFNSLTLPSGIYFYHLKTAEFVQTRKMMLMK